MGLGQPWKVGGLEVTPKNAHSRRIDILRLIEEGEKGYAEIMAATGLSRPGVGPHIETLLDERKIHVSSYEKVRNAYARRFSFGNKPDVPPPFKENRVKTRVRRTKNQPAMRDPMVSAFFGSAA